MAVVSLDDPVRPQQERLRDREAQGFGALAVDDEGEFCRSLNRQIKESSQRRRNGGEVPR